MTQGTKINKDTAETLILLVAIATIGFLLACAGAQRYEPKSPGMYGLKGWNFAEIWGEQAADVDVNGEVGHPVHVWGPQCNCVTNAGKSQPWSGDTRIVSASGLPPGLEFRDGDHIKGIPKERGHWIVTLELYNLECGGNHYKGFRQEVRFHITGTGKVIQ